MKMCDEEEMRGGGGEQGQQAKHGRARGQGESHRRRGKSLMNQVSLLLIRVPAFDCSQFKTEGVLAPAEN